MVTLTRPTGATGVTAVRLFVEMTVTEDAGSETKCHTRPDFKSAA